MSQQHYVRVVNELREVLGYGPANVLAQGNGLKIDNYTVTFLHDEHFDAGAMAIYVDLGQASSDPVSLKTILRVNFELTASNGGALSIHPETDRVFFSFRYELNPAATGEALLERLAGLITEVALETELAEA